MPRGRKAAETPEIGDESGYETEAGLQAEGKGLPAQKRREHAGWLVMAKVQFRGTDEKTHLIDEVPRHPGKDSASLGLRKMRQLPSGEKVPVTAEEDPPIIPLELIPMQQAQEFEDKGALAPYYA
jgi:hypothetical protein